MDLLKIATDLFMSNTNSNNLDAGTVMNGLKGLLADQSGNINLAGLVSQFGSSGLGALASSWLGDGNNESLTTQQLTDTLGMNTDSATSGLAAMIPQLMDKSSSGGSLLSTDTLGKVMGGLGGLFK